MSLINTLFVSSIPDDKLVKVFKILPNSEPLLVLTGSSNVYKNINSKHIKKRYTKLDLNERQKLDFNGVDIIFNQISDADSHYLSLKKLEKILKSKNIKVINHPTFVLNTSRHKIYKNLKDIKKLIVPKSIKAKFIHPKEIEEEIKKHNFDFPVLLRKSGNHGGKSLKQIGSFEELYELYDVSLDGSSFYLTQYINYSKEEIFSKYRLVIVNGEVFIRHVIFSDTWMIHSRSRDFMQNNKAYEEKEIEILESFESDIKPNIKNTIKKICEKVKLDYFGIDCYIDEEFNILIFELNANMNILSNNSKTKIFSTKIELIKKEIEKLILKKKEE